MGLFQRKEQPKQPPQKAPIDETSDGIQRFFDGYFAELRMRGREQFDKSLEAYTVSFKQDLNAAVAGVDVQLREHITHQIDQQIVDNNAVLQHGQQQVLQSLGQSAQELQAQHQHLAQTLQKDIAVQQSALTAAFQDAQAQIDAMKTAQAQTLQLLQQSVQTMQEQQQKLIDEVHANAAAQQTALVSAFQANMARIIEHYLLQAVGDQYDLKAQLPSIIKQMEANKQAIVDDMTL